MAIWPGAGSGMTEQPEFSTNYYQKKTLFELLPNTENEIIFLGNSITDGGERMELFSNSNIKNRGISGDVIRGVLYRLDEVTESNPIWVFIMIGINDLAIGREPDGVIKDYARILDRIRESNPGMKIYIQSILPVNDSFGQFEDHTSKAMEIKQVNSKLEIMAKQRHCEYINLDPVFADESGRLKANFTNDGLHLTGPGCIAWKHGIEIYLNAQ